MTASVPADARPRLALGVRLKEDRTRGGHVLLAPERVVAANPTAIAILSRCDGERSFAAIVDELAGLYATDRARIAADAEAVLSDLVAKRMVEL